jgi:hypothetical protein
LETAKKLDEAGIKIESVCWWWVCQSYQEPRLLDHKPIIWMDDVNIYPALTAEEIELLPIVESGEKYIAYIYSPYESIGVGHSTNYWCVYSSTNKIEIDNCLVWDKNERECELKANMLLWRNRYLKGENL